MQVAQTPFQAWSAWVPEILPMIEADLAKPPLRTPAVAPLPSAPTPLGNPHPPPSSTASLAALHQPTSPQPSVPGPGSPPATVCCTTAGGGGPTPPRLLSLPPRCDVPPPSGAIFLLGPFVDLYPRTQALLASHATFAAPVPTATLQQWAALLAQPDLPLARLCVALDHRSRHTISLDCPGFSAVDAMVAEALRRRRGWAWRLHHWETRLPNFHRWCIWATEEMQQQVIAALASHPETGEGPAGATGDGGQTPGPEPLGLPPRRPVPPRGPHPTPPTADYGLALPATDALLLSYADLAATLQQWAALLARPELPLGSLCAALDRRSRHTVSLDSNCFSLVDAMVAEALGRRWPQLPALLLHWEKRLPHFCQWCGWATAELTRLEAATHAATLHELPSMDDGVGPSATADPGDGFPEAQRLLHAHPTMFRPVQQETLEKWRRALSRPFTVAQCYALCIAIDRRVRRTTALGAPTLSLVDVLAYEALTTDSPNTLSNMRDTLCDMRWRQQGRLRHFHRWMRWVEGQLAPLSAWPSRLPLAPPNCGRRWLTVDAGPPTGSPGFTVVSYNMLASFHLQDRRGRPKDKALEDRVPRLAAELRSYDATFLCLQEVDAADFNGGRSLPDMLNAGGPQRYAWRYQQRHAPSHISKGGPRLDGLAIVWDSTWARPCHEEEWGFTDFNDLAVDSRGQTNNGALRAFFEVDGQPLCVVCAYVHWDPKKEMLKVNQVQQLRRETERAAARVNVSAIVIAGDFNSLPGSDAHSKMVASSKGGAVFASAYGRYLDLEQAQLPAALRQSGGCSHSSRELHREPRYTNVNVPKQFCDTLDYVFYRPGVLTARRVLHFPPSAETTCLPNEVWGSDHLALVAELAFATPRSPG